MDELKEFKKHILFTGFDLNTRNQERIFNLILALTTLNGAFFTIVIPLVKNFNSKLLFLSGVCSFLTVVIGIIYLLVTISRDKKIINEQTIFLLKVIAETEKNKDYNYREEIDDWAIKKKKEFSAKFLIFLKVVFWIFLWFSLISLLLWWFSQVFNIEINF